MKIWGEIRHFGNSALVLLRLTIITPAKTRIADNIFCQLSISIPMQMLIAVAMMG